MRDAGIIIRAVDTAGQSIDFLLIAKRDVATALRHFRKAIRHHGEPEVVTIDKSGANTAALFMLNADKPDEEAITVRQNSTLTTLSSKITKISNIGVDRCWDSTLFDGHRPCRRELN